VECVKKFFIFIRIYIGFGIKKSILASAIMAVLLASVTVVIAVTPFYSASDTIQSAAAAEEEKNKEKGKGQGNKNDQAREELLQELRGSDTQKDAPIATSGNNIYIAWWTNKTGNNEVMFRASTDVSKTFGDKINLSNSTKADSQDADAQIDASGNRVFVTWWERNATSNQPVLKISSDNGKSFGPVLKLSANGTIGSSG
jgi:hypothetical protein